MLFHIIVSRGVGDVSSGFLPITMRVIDKMTSIAKYFIELVLEATSLLGYKICIQALKAQCMDTFSKLIKHQTLRAGRVLRKHLV